MIKVIVVFPKREVAVKMKNILMKNGFEVVGICLTGAQAIRQTERMEAGVVVSSVRYRDMIYHDLLDLLPDTFPMIVISSPSQWQEYGEDDAVYLPLPLKFYDLIDTVSDLCAQVAGALKKSRQKPPQRSEGERGIINQAKLVLMEQAGYSEEEAHRYLQKQSMDSGNNMVDTAYMVLDVYRGSPAGEGR